MGSKVKGLALIINIMTFLNNVHEERHGSEHDVRRLTSILEQMDYKVITREDLKRKEIIEEVKNFAKMKELYDCDSCIVAVMSHGEDASYSENVYIVGHDKETVESAWIIRQFNASNCPALSNKPKMFFFQACRGGDFNILVQHKSRGDGSKIETDGIRMNQNEGKVRKDADVFVGYSTTTGHVSHRDMDTGSWYIQSLCQVFAKYAWNTDLATMLEYVDKDVSNKSSRGAYQTSASFDTMDRKLYFHPGLYDTS